MLLINQSNIVHLPSLLAPAVVWLLSAFGTLAIEPDIPRLDWEQRSDWLNVKQHSPAAMGDGAADDTAAIQAALDVGAEGRTIYFPPGRYRLTQTLVFHGPGKGSLMVGHGRDTVLVWDGATGGCMFRSDGIAYSRYAGLSWDGRNRAAVGFDHASQKRFETEVSHEYESFRNFTGYGIRAGADQKVASAEILYENCLFENCGTAIGLLTFNDYDNTIDRCEFRNCGTGVISHKSNFYARDSHFENSREADFIVEAEHGCSIRRCTSFGSRKFVWERGTIAPLTIQDCQVAAWTDPEAAVILNGSPVLIFDSAFSPSASNLPPVLAASSSQKVMLCRNQPSEIARLIRGAAASNVQVIPAGGQAGVVADAQEHFLQPTVSVGGHVFDAVRDFGAKADGKNDDTAAIQAAISAARQHGRGAVAYLPTGRYVVTRTILVTGAHYQLAGSGFDCGLLWRGGAGTTLMLVSNVEDVVLSHLAVGHHDFGQMNHGDDILVQASEDFPLTLTLDEIYGHGMYQKSPDRHGIHFDHLGPSCVINARHVQGNLKISDCAAARLLFRTSYEGTVTISGTDSSRDGLTGFLTRLSTVSDPALRVRDNQSVVMSDFYAEQSSEIGQFSGGSNSPSGRITIQSPKIHSFTNSVLYEARDYSGRIYIGQSEFYCQPEETRFLLSGRVKPRLVLAGNFWYNNHPVLPSGDGQVFTLLGNVGAADSPANPAGLAAIASALDDLRDLGILDLKLTW